MTAPNKVWAVFEAHENPKDKVPRVFASASPTKGEEYTRSDEQMEMLTQRLEEIAAEDAPYLNDMGNSHRRREIAQDALRALVEGDSHE